MFDLARYITETHRERNQSERNEVPPNQRLIPSAESSTEITTSNDTAVGILQPHLQNNARPSSLHLSNVIPSEVEGNNGQQVNFQENQDKINITSALLTFVLYICCITMVIYGAVHFKDCPVQNMITISYIVMGCLMLFSRILSSPEECRDIFNKERNTRFIPQTFCRMCFNFIVQIGVVCFFFALCYWVFNINPDTKEDSPNYCQKEFYKNTYYGCIAGLSILGFTFLLICCGVCFVCYRSASDK